MEKSKKVVDNKHIKITKERTYLNSVFILENVYTNKALTEEIELDELEFSISIK